ncbi:putative structural domain protein [Photobacterium leiognathi lrivu.4.1]|uniref:Putative structural domain protein n=1 Tax=Photobacterium leiognathi lrivu.4.1 TaxID=1248232 RepID=A0A0U1P5G9_PHOLE|nr:XkdF-like putative serine protease domain-containing protein [Photobacterium leiognathi]GAD29798.1 putative structural domain protein [Photobacterium leiognathi lrivu.4.1]
MSIEDKYSKTQHEMTGPVLVPEEVDHHGDVYSYDAVLDACREYNELCNNTNLQHILQLEDGSAKVVESYILPADMVVGDKVIKAGTWMMTMRVESDSLWSRIQAGEFTGFSIGSSAMVEDLTSEDKFKSLGFALKDGVYVGEFHKYKHQPSGHESVDLDKLKFPNKYK